jgi:hypothetical protein
MKADDEKLISKLLDETYNKNSHNARSSVSNVVNLADYFNRRENYYKDQSKGIKVNELMFYFKDYGDYRRLIFGDHKIDIPKGLGIIKIDPTYEEEIVFKISDEVFRSVISKTLAKEISHLWITGGSSGQFIPKGEKVELLKIAA